MEPFYDSDTEETGPCHGFNPEEVIDVDFRMHYQALNGNLIGLQKSLQDLQHPELLNEGVIDLNRKTPLHCAITGGHVDCVRELLKHAGVEVDRVDIKCQTPLFIAVYNSNLECCKVLLASGANPNGDSRNLVRPLDTACQNGFTDVAHLLLIHGAAIEGHSTHPLHMAATYGHRDCFISLLLYGARTDLQQYSIGSKSLPSVLLRKCKDEPLFLKLWVLFGGSLWYTEQKTGLRVFPVGIGAPYPMLVQIYSEPLSLKSLCRIKIWKESRRGFFSQIPFLGLPKTLAQFLAYRDIPEIDYNVQKIAELSET